MSREEVEHKDVKSWKSHIREHFPHAKITKEDGSGKTYGDKGSYTAHTGSDMQSDVVGTHNGSDYGWAYKGDKMKKSGKLNKAEARTQTKFIAFNANNVSKRLIDHISANDHVGLQQASKNLNDSSSVIASWVENAGGTIISRAVDEIIAMVPEESLGSLDNVKRDYKEMSGHYLSSGICDSLGVGCFALIGNKNGASSLDEDEVVNRDPNADNDPDADVDADGISDDEENHGSIDEEGDDLDNDGEVSHEEAQDADGIPDDEKETPAEELPQDGNPEDAPLEEATPEDTSEEGFSEDEPVGEEVIDDEGVPPEGDVADEDFVEGEAAATEVEDEHGEEAAEEYAEEVPEMDDTEEQEVPEHEQDMDPETKAIHDATEPDSDEEEVQDDQDAEAGRSKEIDPDAIEEAQEEIPDLTEEDVAASSDDGAEQGDLEPEEQELYDLLSDDLNEGSEAGSVQEAKQRIVETLNTLRQNKEGIENLKHTDPNAYSSLLDFIRSMIDMAKQAEASNSEQPEENPAEEDAAPEAIAEEAPEEVPEDEKSDDEETDPVKKL